tara:strand:- start:606 stop:812 length:207 start_codon:yes stop_codon:yes gene_type:complete
LIPAMNDEDKDKVIEWIASNIFNQLNINGIVEAAKFYSINLASQDYEKLSEEDGLKILEEIESQTVAE